MGFLQNDTSNIILDAVLTDKGRELLARNDGSFSVAKFALGDDEVDYSIIEKFGRTIGKEKIEKNTPVFEALTNESYALKYKLVSVSNPNLIRLPSLTITGESFSSGVLTIGATTQRTRLITVSQVIVNETSIDVDLRDQTFIVEISNMFLQIVGQTPDSISSQQRASYILVRNAGESSLGGSRLSFTLSTKSITDGQFQVYGTSYNKNLISTFVRISGIQSGAVYEFETQINKTT